MRLKNCEKRGLKYDFGQSFALRVAKFSGEIEPPLIVLSCVPPFLQGAFLISPLTAIMHLKVEARLTSAARWRISTFFFFFECTAASRLLNFAANKRSSWAAAGFLLFFDMRIDFDRSTVCISREIVRSTSGQYSFTWNGIETWFNIISSHYIRPASTPGVIRQGNRLARSVWKIGSWWIDPMGYD